MLGRVFAIGVFGLCLGSAAMAADHREAPGVNLRPAADLADLYVFQSPANAANVVLIMTVNPLADPDFAGSYAFDPSVLYRFGIDTRGNGRDDNVLDILFEPADGGVQPFTVRLNDRVILSGTTTPPNPFAPFAPQIHRQGSVSAFAGPSDDPFFFDGLGFQAFVAGLGTFRGEDSFAGFNVSSIVLELPLATISNGKSNLAFSAFTFNARPPVDERFGAPTVEVAGRLFQQFERTGNPGVATAFVPFDRRDEFNQTRPADDAARFAGVIVNSLRGLGTPQANIDLLASIAVPDTIKFDSRQPVSFPNGRQLSDDVIDTVLSVVLDTAVSDGVDANDREFSASFPYLAPPHQPTAPAQP